MEKNETRPSLGELIVLPPRKPAALRTRHADAGLIVQLLSIRDNHPQWRKLKREDGVIAAHKYAAQLKDFHVHLSLGEGGSAPHNVTEL